MCGVRARAVWQHGRGSGAGSAVDILGGRVRSEVSRLVKGLVVAITMLGRAYGFPCRRALVYWHSELGHVGRVMGTSHAILSRRDWGLELIF